MVDLGRSPCKKTKWIGFNPCIIPTSGGKKGFKWGFQAKEDIAVKVDGGSIQISQGPTPYTDSPSSLFLKNVKVDYP
jgi:hypothetical protein